MIGQSLLCIYSNNHQTSTTTSLYIPYLPRLCGSRAALKGIECLKAPRKGKEIRGIYEVYKLICT